MRRRAIYVAVALGAGLALRVAIIAGTDYVPTADAASFDRHGVSIAQGLGYPPSRLAEGPSAFRPPGLPYALAGLYAATGTEDSETRWTVGRVAQSVGSVAAAGLIGLMALRLWGDRRIAYAALVIAALFPPWLMWSTTLLSEPLFVFLEVGTVLAALAFRRQPERLRWILLAGALVGLATLTRPNGAVLLVPVALAAWARRPRGSLRAVVPPLVAILAAAALIVPWTIRNARTFDAFVPVHTETGFALAGTYNDQAAGREDCPACFVWFIPPEYVPLLRPGMNEVEVEATMRRAGLHYLRTHPTYLGRVVFWNAIRMVGGGGISLEQKVARQASAPAALPWLSLIGFWVVLALAVGGASTHRARTWPGWLVATPALLFASVLPILGNSRYRAPVDPFLILLAAAFLVSLIDRARTRDAKRALEIPV